MFVLVSALVLVIAEGINLASWPVFFADPEGYPVWIDWWDYFYTPSVLLFLSTSLCTASVYLVINVRSHFPVGLKAEACRVQTINIVFTVAYLTRALTFIVTDYINPYADPEFAEYLTYYIGYNFWDVVPLTLIMSYHYQHFLSESTAEHD